MGLALRLGTKSRFARIGAIPTALFVIQLPATFRPDQARAEPLARPMVGFNSNSAGCVVPHIDRYAVGERQVDVTVTLSRPPEPRPKDLVCTCREGGYYATVFPSAKALQDDRAWQTSPRPYKAHIGYAVIPHRPLPWTGTFHFPAFKANGAPYTFYYLDLGCP